MNQSGKMNRLARLGLLLALTSCGSEPAATKEVGGSLAPELESFYRATPPAGAVEVSALRALKSGQHVVVRGDVQNYEPIAGKAALVLYDHALKSCDESGDADGCKTPWDFCCLDAAVCAQGSVLVEFRQGEQLVGAALAGFHGIDHLSDVVVGGTLELDPQGNATLLADSIHVE